MNNTSMCKKSLAEINLTAFKEAIFLCYKDGITSCAPLGFSGDTIVLFELKDENKSGRVSQVSIRNYCNDAELLITDIKGNFLFYGRFDINFGVSFLAKFYLKIFNSVKHMIEHDMPNTSNFSKLKIPLNVKKTIGFDMIRAFQKSGI